MKNCVVFHEAARFASSHEIAAGSETIRADRIFINVGGRAVVPDLPGIDQVSYLTNSSILELEELPDHLVIVGGSYVVLYFPQYQRSLEC